MDVPEAPDQGDSRPVRWPDFRDEHCAVRRGERAVAPGAPAVCGPGTEPSPPCAPSVKPSQAADAPGQVNGLGGKLAVATADQCRPPSVLLSTNSLPWPTPFSTARPTWAVPKQTSGMGPRQRWDGAALQLVGPGDREEAPTAALVVGGDHPRPARLVADDADAKGRRYQLEPPSRLGHTNTCLPTSRRTPGRRSGRRTRSPRPSWSRPPRARERYVGHRRSGQPSPKPSAPPTRRTCGRLDDGCIDGVVRGCINLVRYARAHPATLAQRAKGAPDRC